MRAAKRAASGVGVTTVGARSVRTPGLAVGGIAVGSAVAVGAAGRGASLHAAKNKSRLAKVEPFSKKDAYRFLPTRIVYLSFVYFD